MGIAEARGGEGAPIAALHRKTSVAERVVHQLGDAVGDLLDPEARLPRPERQAVAGKRRCHDGECVLKVAAKTHRVGQARDQLQKLEYRARPTVQQQKRTRGWPFARHVQKMQVDAAERYSELRKGVEPRFLGPPIKAVAPIFDKLPKISDICPIGPRLAGRLVWKAGALEPLRQIGNRLPGDPVGENLWLFCHGGLFWLGGSA